LLAFTGNSPGLGFDRLSSSGRIGPGKFRLASALPTEVIVPTSRPPDVRFPAGLAGILATVLLYPEELGVSVHCGSHVWSQLLIAVHEEETSVLPLETTAS
jgi:hypothetical protein